MPTTDNAVPPGVAEPLSDISKIPRGNHTTDNAVPLGVPKPGQNDGHQLDVQGNEMFNGTFVASQLQIDLISTALGPGPSEEVISTCGSISLKRCDFQTLNELRWLNDQVSISVYCYLQLYIPLLQVLNAYFKLISAAYGDVYVYSTFFYSKLASGGYEAVQHWTKRKMCCVTKFCYFQSTLMCTGAWLV